MSDLFSRIANLPPEKRALLELLKDSKGEKPKETIPRLVRQEQASSFPLSFAQERLWFFDQLEPGSSVYNIHRAMRITGALNESALRRALEELVVRHESLRATFENVNGTPVLVIAERLPELVVALDLSALEQAERANEMRRLIDEEAGRPFDLASGPLLRAVLLRLGDQEHVLSLTMHHIISDGWSMRILLRELSLLYTAFSEGRPTSLPNLPIQYSDFARWQREWLQGEVLASQISYWKQKLEGAPESVELLTDYPRPRIQTFHGAREYLTLPKTTSESLKTLARQEGCTLFMTLLAAFAVLLHRYSVQDDIVVGSPIAGRNRLEIEGLIGFFINTLILRIDLSGDPSFQALLTQVKEVALGAYAHQDLPFEKLVEVLQPERSLSRNPLVQVFINMLNLASDRMELPGLRIESFLASEGGSKFDLTLYVEEQGQEINLVSVYDTNLFERRRMVVMLEQFQCLLEQIVAAPEKKIHSLSLLTPKSRPLLPDPNALIPEPRFDSITRVFLSWAKRMPEHPAVSQASKTWSYQELAGNAITLAQILLADGLQPGEAVAVTGPRSYGLTVSMMAVLLSRGVLLTIDPKLPASRQQLMLREADAKRLLYCGRPRPEDEWMREQALVITYVHPHKGRAVESERPAKLTAEVLPEVTPDDAAYIFFTSGTTGIPKGVLGSHKGLSHFLSWQREEFAVDSDDRCAQLTSLSFDVLLRDVFLPLTSGATLCLPDKIDEVGPGSIIPWLERERISLLHVVPALAQAWLSDIPEGITLRNLRWVFFAGEPLTEPLVRRWRESFPGAGGIINLYGPTETTMVKCFYRVPIKLTPGVQPLGRSLPETQALVLSENNRLCGIGEIGEIVLRTPFRTLGYINAIEENQKRFVKNPFSDDGRDLLYHTGDRGRYRFDGTLEFQGRLDNQVKIRGFRIELGEVETVLAAHPAVKAAVVLAREDVADEKRLVAYVVPLPGQTAVVGKIRSFLKQQLPEYMVPSAFVLLEALPLTPNGKVDCRALPAPDPASLELESKFVPPRTPVEEILAGIWANVLGLQRVGIHDNFFDLGGHSLLATRVVSAIRKTFQVELPLRSVFEVSTVADLGERIERSLERGLKAPSLKPVSRQGPVALSFAQQRLWLLHQLAPDNPAYNIASAYRLDGLLNVNALEQSFNEILRRHEVLRTTFSLEEGQPVQVIHPAMNFKLPVVDLSELSKTESEKETRRLAEEEARRPFNLARGPVFRATLLRLGQLEHVLLLTLHHIASDGWSRRVLFQELAALYKAFSAGQPSPLAQLPIQYADFAIWQRHWLQGEVLAAHLKYWKEQARDLPVLELPADRRRPPVQTFRGEAQSLVLSQSLSESLQALSRTEGVTLFMTLLAAFQVLLCRRSGQEDIVVGAPIANRNRAEIEGLIGFFVNTLVLRSDLSGQPSFRELLGRVREVCLSAYAHQDLPFEKLVEELRPPRDLSRNPLVQVAFAFQNLPSNAPQLSGLTLGRLEIDSGTTKFDLAMLLTEEAKKLKAVLKYNMDLFEAATIKAMLGDFRTLLEEIATNPDRHVGASPPKEQALGQQHRNSTSLACPAILSIADLLDLKAAQSPNAIAIAAPGRKPLTYGGLRTHIHDVIVTLNTMGVGLNDRIAIVLPNGPEMAVAFLAVAVAATSAPLNPGYRANEFDFYLSDLNAKALIVQSGLDSPARAVAEARGTPIIELLPRLDAEAGTFTLTGGRPLGPACCRRAQPDDVALVLHTSGTTSRPKLVPLTHRNLCTSAENIRVALQLAESDSCLNVMPLFHIHGLVGATLSSLLAGATVVCTPGFEAGVFFKWFEDFCPTWYTAVPTMHQAILERAVSHRTTIENSPLRFIRSSSSALPSRLMSDLENAFNVPVIEAYGMTEASHQMTSNPLPPGERKPGSAGLAAGPDVAVMDEQGNLLSPGNVGEIVIRGATVTRGYENNPTANQSAFINGWFRTGDQGCIDAEGYLFIRGRIKEIINRGGEKVSPREIDEVFMDHPAVAQVVTFAVPHATLGEDVASAVVLKPDSFVSEKEMREFAFSRLTDHKVPSQVLIVDQIPKGATGKLQRIGLAEKLASRLSAEFVAPRNRIEETLTKIWTEVLNVKQVGIHDNFFTLGGDSLLATQIVSRVRAVLHVDLPLNAIFRDPSIADLSSVIETCQVQEDGHESIFALLGELEELSEEDAELLLSEEMRSAKNQNINAASDFSKQERAWK